MFVCWSENNGTKVEGKQDRFFYSRGNNMHNILTGKQVL